MIRRGHFAASRAARREREIGEADQGSGEAHRYLVSAPAPLHKRAVNTPEIFDRTLRRKRRDRAAARYPEFAFLREHMLEGIAERLDEVKRDFRDVLDLGSFDGSFTLPGATITRLDAGAAFAAQSAGIQADEDRLPFPEASFDLIVSAGVLDQVNDVPGALIQIRRALRPDGLFLGAFAGAGSLAVARSAFLAAEPAARFHPQIDVRSAGDLLSRAGFALPVADVETLTVRYAGIANLLRDLRGMAATNLLPGASPLTRATLMRAAEDFAAQSDPDGRTAERFEIVYLTGWAPDASQPQPAKRGSATASLADALKVKP
jgi:SAM-dependent methyltransferase